MRRDRGRQAKIWLGLFTVLSIVLFALAISNAVYEATSPGWLSFHVLLRKLYSVGAFGLVGFALAQTARFAGRAWGPARVGLVIGFYSALIEAGQAVLSGGRETLGQQSFDVACGLVGGALGALIAGTFARRSDRPGR